MRILSFAALLLALLTPQAAVSASRPDLVNLERQLHQMAATLPSDYGIAAVDLKDGSVVSVNGDKPFPMASTMKIAVAALYLARVETGQRSMDAMIGGRTAASQIERMIVYSDNVATDMLMANLGGPAAVQGWLQYHRIPGIRVDRTIAQLLRDKRNLNDWQDVSTPLGMAHLLVKLQSNEALNLNSRTYLFDLMSQVRTGTRRIRGLLPAGTRVEDKTGTLNGITNDVGYIVMPDGNRIAIAVFARGGRDRTPGIAMAARTIYDHFASRIMTSWTGG